MKKVLYNLTRVVIIVLVGVVVWKCSNRSENDTLPTSVCEHNRQCYEDVREDLLAVTALVEGFHKNPYHCGAKWTQGFGSTIHRNGKRVTKRDATISLTEAKKDVYAHYDTHVWPWIEKYVTRKLSKEQMIGTCSFIYNVGGESFSGHTKDGKVLQKPKTVKVTAKNKKGKKVTKKKTVWVDVQPSSFLLAINTGKSDEETAICMNGYRCSAGKLASGLPKRHWIEGAIYQGLITTEDILNLEPKRFYEKNKGFNISFYYKNRRGPYWTHDYSEKKVREFLQKNHSDKNNVRALI
ncbi:MAG: hypothetical protein IJ660_07730 [Alphaproteobacteria bacterium]|nr:hypothetical protein [Alphaproteobacteria bacterium]